ncbi:hypothetical protein C2S53_004161 [Perilla frutescens var. hirtella]|uniref:Defensin-like protein n=1 Tax=Perilla frutescens var. hirtella TaxID=608512 RepID=A0AAD4JJ59_PERFH|nr:hypothetical protein C2S53_004161 [Perilla frutescens var. hirtella]
MASINPSICILLILTFASVAELGIAKRCQSGYGFCGEKDCCGGGVCGEPCCKYKCLSDHANANPQAGCDKVGAIKLCVCEYDC